MKNNSVKIFEVGPRDGLQNEPRQLSLKDKIWFVNSLIGAGFKDIELGAFVRPDRVPQMADTDSVYSEIQKGKLKLGSTRAWSLVPNRIGLERALRVGVTRIAVFTAASETFAQKNIGMSIRDSLAEFRQVIADARAALGNRLEVRGYVSTAFGCPFEGSITPKKVLGVVEKLAALGVDQVSIGDTIGVATPLGVEKIVQPAIKILGMEKTAVHFHDTRGTALANTLRALDLGVRIVDSAAGGFGGCPFAPGAAGNLATEDLVYMLNGMGIKTGINLSLLCETSLVLSKKMKRPLTSRYLQTFSVQNKL
jgi:hydroxymethylglutaryl-CoA lyase